MQRAHYSTRGGWRGAVVCCRSAPGFALITTLLLLVLLTTSVTTAITVGGLQNRVSGNLQNGLQATYLAEAGMQLALRQLRRDPQWRTGIAETALGPGTYLIVVSQPQPTADLNVIVKGKVAGAERTITYTLRYEIITVAGTGSNGSSGDGGPATAARFKQPGALAFDAQGNLFIADRDSHRIRRVTPGAESLIMGATDELISTVVGTGSEGFSGDGGPATAARLDQPRALAFDAQGNLFIADQESHRIRRVTPGADGLITGAAGELISTIAGTGSDGFSGDGGPAMAARLDQPRALAFDAQGNLFIADQENHRIRRVTPGADGRITGAADELISTVVGTGNSGFSGDGGPATAARLDDPRALAFDAQGNLFIADWDNHRIRRVTPGADGRITGAADELISTVVGTGSAGFSGDGGLATAARLDQPWTLAFDAQGNLFIADQHDYYIFFSEQHDYRIRRVIPGADGRITGAADELISTVVGTGNAGSSGDGGPPTGAEINQPEGVISDVNRNLVIADSSNERVRRTRWRIIRWQDS